MRQQAGRHRDVRIKAAGGAASSASSSTADRGKSTSLSTSKTREHHTPVAVGKDAAKVRLMLCSILTFLLLTFLLTVHLYMCVCMLKLDRHKHSSTIGSSRANGKTAPLPNSVTGGRGKAGLKDMLVTGDTGLKDSVMCLTNEQLQQILSTVQTSCSDRHAPEEHRMQGSDS